MAQIPAKFSTCFWDAKFDELDIRNNSDFIIIRLYTKGGFPGIFWVEKTYSSDDIIHAAKNRRDLDPIVANYLKEKYAIRKEDMNYYRLNNGMTWR